MVTFEKAGQQNAEETLRIALARAKELDCPIVISSTMGPGVKINPAKLTNN